MASVSALYFGRINRLYLYINFRTPSVRCQSLSVSRSKGTVALSACKSEDLSDYEASFPLQGPCAEVLVSNSPVSPSEHSLPILSMLNELQFVAGSWIGSSSTFVFTFQVDFAIDRSCSFTVVNSQTSFVYPAGLSCLLCGYVLGCQQHHVLRSLPSEGWEDLVGCWSCHSNEFAHFAARKHLAQPTRDALLLGTLDYFVHPASLLYQANRGFCGGCSSPLSSGTALEPPCVNFSVFSVVYSLSPAALISPMVLLEQTLVKVLDHYVQYDSKYSFRVLLGSESGDNTVESLCVNIANTSALLCVSVSDAYPCLQTRDTGVITSEVLVLHLALEASRDAQDIPMPPSQFRSLKSLLQSRESLEMIQPNLTFLFR